MPKTHDQTIAVRLPAKLMRAVVKHQTKDETISHVVRRLLSVALGIPHLPHDKP